MAMKVERIRADQERLVLIAMIVSRAVLGPVADRWERGLFASSWSNLVGGWAVTHFRKYRKAPGKAITQYFLSWAESGRDRETVELVESFLGSLSDEWVRIKDSMSPEHLIDVAGQLFEKVRLADLAARISAHLEVGEVDKARSLVDRSRRVEIGMGSATDLLSDPTAMTRAFAYNPESLVEYPGAAGNFFGDALCRDGFVGFVSKDKSGKSFWIQDLAWRAVEQGRTVAYFEAGDLSEAQLFRRFAVRATGKTAKLKKYHYPRELESSGKGDPKVVSEWVTPKEVLSEEEAIAAMEAARDKYGPDKLRVSCHPNGTLSAAMVETFVETWARDGWYADLVLCDYPDIMAPDDPRDEERDRINKMWMRLRAISQKFHCLVVVVTQGNKDSYEDRILSRSNFSGDKRKNAHVTAMVGINQTDKEKEKGLYRLNWVVARELDFGERKCLWTASCLAIGNPCVHSTF